MRAVLLLLIALGIFVSGCSQQQVVSNSTENMTPPVQPCTGPVCGSDGKTYNTDCEAGLANVSVLYMGACQAAANCTKSNGGVNTDVKGTITLGNESHDDYCIDNSTVNEYVCMNNTINSVSVACGSGKMCEDGHCVAVQPAPGPANSSVNSTTTPAVNSTNRGCVGPTSTDINNANNVTFNGSTYADVCNTYTAVKDYYCQDNKLQNSILDCPGGSSCDLGKCVQLTWSCTRTGGNGSATGHTIVTHGLYTTLDELDKCIDIQMISGYTCQDNGTAQYFEKSCGNGMECENGHCIPSMCSATNGGDNKFQYGSVTTNETSPPTTKVDACIDYGSLQEYYCYGNDIVGSVEYCDGGFICNNGACVPGNITG